MLMGTKKFFCCFDLKINFLYEIIGYELYLDVHAHSKSILRKFLHIDVYEPYFWDILKNA